MPSENESAQTIGKDTPPLVKKNSPCRVRLARLKTTDTPRHFGKAISHFLQMGLPHSRITPPGHQRLVPHARDSDRPQEEIQVRPGIHRRTRTLKVTVKRRIRVNDKIDLREQLGRKQDILAWSDFDISRCANRIFADTATPRV